MQIGVITNPRSRKNRGHPERADRLQSILGPLGEVHATASIESIKPVLREFLRKRARYWVADGGDGALHWMLRLGMEVLQEEDLPVDHVMPLPILPTKGGTIDFVANNVGIRGTAESILAGLRRHIETGRTVEEVEVDSMLIDAIEVTDQGERRFRTYGFACAAAGVGQRFFSKYYSAPDPNPRTIVQVVGKTVASLPAAMTPLRYLPWVGQLGRYAREILEPTPARVGLDGMILPDETFTGINIASMSINLGNVFRLFHKAEAPGVMHALVGTASPITMLFNLPRMARGKELRGNNVLDRACRELVIRASGDELLAPVIDGEYYPNLREIRFRLGPRVRIPKVVPKATDAAADARAAA